MYNCVGSLGVTEVFDLCTNNINCVRLKHCIDDN